MNQLDVCETCLNRNFNPAKGLVCELTNEKPNFVEKCPDYNEDPKYTTKGKSNQNQLDYRIAALEARVSILWVVFIVSVFLLIVTVIWLLLFL